MKNIILSITLLFMVSPATLFALSQEEMETLFPNAVVEGFDHYDDWTGEGPGGGCDSYPDTALYTADGEPSEFIYQNCWWKRDNDNGETRPVTIQDHGSDKTVTGKSMRFSYTGNGSGFGHGEVSDARSFAGTVGDDTSGFSDVNVFFRMYLSSKAFPTYSYDDTDETVPCYDYDDDGNITPCYVEGKAYADPDSWKWICISAGYADGLTFTDKDRDSNACRWGVNEVQFSIGSGASTNRTKRIYLYHPDSEGPNKVENRLVDLKPFFDKNIGVEIQLTRESAPGANDGEASVWFYDTDGTATLVYTITNTNFFNTMADHTDGSCVGAYDDLDDTAVGGDPSLLLTQDLINSYNFNRVNFEANKRLGKVTIPPDINGGSPADGNNSAGGTEKNTSGVVIGDMETDWYLDDVIIQDGRIGLAYYAYVNDQPCSVDFPTQCDQAGCEGLVPPHYWYDDMCHDTAEPVDETWQEELEAAFGPNAYVFTFDNLDNWAGTTAQSGAAKSYLPSDMPKTISGDDTRIVGYQYEGADESEVGDWVGDHGDYTLDGSGKSISLAFQNTGFEYDFYGPSDLFLYVGNQDETSGTRNDGFESIYIFYWLKLRHDEFDITSAEYYWLPTGTNNEYYLSAGTTATDPDLPMPNNLIIDGTWVSDPIPYGGSSQSGQYDDYVGDTIGSLTGGEWDYGDPASNGWETLVVRLSDDSDPDSKGTGYIYYENGALVMNSATETQHPIGVWKHVLASQGFWYDKDTSPYVHMYDGTWSDGCGDVNELTYGVNFSLLQMSTYPSGEFATRMDDPAKLAEYNVNCYGYEQFNDPLRFTTTLADALTSRYVNDEGFYVEINYDKGTCDSADGSITVTYYDEDGTGLGTETVSNLQMCRNPQEGGTIDLDNPYNRVNIGGNRFGANSYPYDAADTWDTRYYIDDLIIDSVPIAESYYALRDGNNLPGITGKCGAAADTPPVVDPPTTGLCNAGTPTAVTTGATEYTWQCLGLGSGTNADCSVEIYTDPGLGGTIIRGWQWPDTKHLIRLP